MSNFYLAIGGVVALGLIGSVVAWQAGKAARSVPPDPNELQRSLDRLQQELRKARQLARSPR